MTDIETELRKSIKRFKNVPELPFNLSPKDTEEFNKSGLTLSQYLQRHFKRLAPRIKRHNEMINRFQSLRKTDFSLTTLEELNIKRSGFEAELARNPKLMFQAVKIESDNRKSGRSLKPDGFSKRNVN